MKTIKSSMAAANMLKPYFADSGNEELWILVLNKFCPVLPIKINSGGEKSVEIDFKHIIKETILNDGDAVILFHNHPSNNPYPSVEDMTETSKLKDALNLVGISLIDHIILTSKRYYSFADEKVKKFISVKKNQPCLQQQ